MEKTEDTASRPGRPPNFPNRKLIRIARYVLVEWGDSFKEWYRKMVDKERKREVE